MLEHARARRAMWMGLSSVGLAPAACLACLTLIAGASGCSSGNGATGTNTPDGSTVIDAGSGDATVIDGGVDSGSGDDDGAADASQDWLVPPPIVRDGGEDVLAPQRQACAFGAGAWPAQTLGTDLPVGSDIPINHVIVIMQENRSFDHYLGRLTAQGYYKTGDFSVTPVAAPDAGSDAGASDAGDAGSSTPPDAGVILGSGFSAHDELDTPPPGWSNPDGDGGIVTPHADNEYCYGVDHSWNTQHANWDNGRNDGFVIDNNPGGSRALFYEDDTVIPFYYALANTFSIGDRYFCSVLSSTWPNRYFLMAGTSFGIGDNSACTVDKYGDPAPQIFLRLEQGGHSWKDYTDGPHMVEFFPNFGLSPDALAHYGSVKCDLMADIANGTLPDVSFMMGDEIDPESSDEGPSDLPGVGGLVVETIIRNLWKSPSWKDTAVFITYDENGGIADHVPPAPACAPDNYPPHDVNQKPFQGDFKTTGFRVPFIVVSPYAKKHYVSHTVYDHTSITRFIEARFGLPAMTARDANATPPMEMFDFKSPPFMTPPSISATTTVPPSILKQCGQTMAPTSCDVPVADQ